MQITKRTFTTSHKSEGKVDPYGVDIFTLDTNSIRVTLRVGSLGYERLTVMDMKRGWVLEEFEVFTNPFRQMLGQEPHSYCLEPSCERCEEQRGMVKMDRHLEFWTGLNRKQLFRISDRLERAREAADPFNGYDPYYGGE